MYHHPINTCLGTRYSKGGQSSHHGTFGNMGRYFNCHSWEGGSYWHLPWKGQFSWDQFSRSAASDSLRPHGLQHARPPCPSPAPRVVQTRDAAKGSKMHGTAPFTLTKDKYQDSNIPNAKMEKTWSEETWVFSGIRYSPWIRHDTWLLYLNGLI